MKKWRFFPILVKEKIVKYMYIPDVISIAKCSKKCQNLLVSVPIYLPLIVIDDRPNNIRQPNSNDDFLISLDDFPILATSRKCFFNQLKLCVTTEKSKHDLKELIKKLRDSQKSLKVKKLGMFFVGEHVELFTEILSICDPFYIEEIAIPEISSQEVYEQIVRTPHWKNCNLVMINCKCRDQEALQVNFDDFFHFERVKLQVQTGIENAANLIKIFRNASERASFYSKCRKPMIHQENEKSGVGSWQRQSGISFVVHPTKPDLVFWHKFDIDHSTLTCGWTLADDFVLR